MELRLCLRSCPSLCPSIRLAGADERVQLSLLRALVRAVDPKALVTALKGQTAIAQTMAQFVISAVDIAGPQATLAAEVLKLMKETATQVKTDGKLTKEGPLGELVIALIALTKAPEGRDPVEYASTVLAKFRNDKPKP